MWTLYKLIVRVLKDIGAYNFGQTLDAEEAQDAIDALNLLSNELDNDGFWGFAKLRESFTLNNNQSIYSWGVTTPTSNLNSARPVNVSTCFIREDNLDYPVDIIGEHEYENYPDKTTSGRPEKVWINYTYPAATLYFYPTPDSNYEIFFDSKKDMTDFSSLTAQIILPSPYLQALRWGLCVDLCPSYKKQPSPYMLLRAESSINSIKRINASNSAEPVKLDLPTARGSRGTIFSY